jgi:hypothetical protein
MHQMVIIFSFKILIGDRPRYRSVPARPSASRCASGPKPPRYDVARLSWGPGTGGGGWEVFGKITIFYGYVSLAEGTWFCWDILT